jgi:hypothetical protein
MSNENLTPEQLKAVFNTGNMNGKSWANMADENNAREAAAYAAMTPAQKANHNARKKRLSNLYNIPPMGATRRNNRMPPRPNGRGAAAAWGSRRNNRGAGAAWGSRRNNRGAGAAWGSRRNNRGAPARGAPARGAPAANAWRPRAGKVMRECRDNRTGCARHQATGDCKFIHTGEPEFAHLRANQRL